MRRAFIGGFGKISTTLKQPALSGLGGVDAAGAARGGRSWFRYSHCSSNQVWDHVQPGERTSTAGRRQEKGAGGEGCIVLTEEKDGGEEDPRWEILNHRDRRRSLDVRPDAKCLCWLFCFYIHKVFLKVNQGA